MSSTQISLIDKEREKLERCTPCQSHAKYLSNVCRAKKNGSYRLIMNVKERNKEVEYQKYQMDILVSIITLIRPNCFIARLNL